MTETATIVAHGREAHMHVHSGKIGDCWKAGRYYEQPVLDRIYRLCQDHPSLTRGIAVDGGANFGNHSLWMKVVCGFHKVVAFEPLQTEILMKNLELNGLTGMDVPVCEAALGATRGFAKKVAKGKLERLVGEIDPEDVQVRIETLDDLAGRANEAFDRGVTLLKLDVEDMELPALVGGAHVIMRDRPVIFAECHEGYRDGHDAIFKAMGYRFFGKPMPNNSMLEWHPEAGIADA